MRAPPLPWAWLLLGLSSCASAPAPAAEARTPHPQPGAGEAVLSRVNRERAGVGVAPLEPEAGLATAAMERALARQPGDGGAPTVGSGLALEVTVRGAHVPELVERLLADAPTRSKLLNADATHAGVAVVAVDRGYVLSVLAARLAPKADVVHAPAYLLSLLNRGRSARGARPLAADSSLQTAATAAAARFFEAPLPSERELVDGLHQELEPLALAYSRVEATVAVVTTVDEAATLDPAFDPSAVAVGVGVAQGHRLEHGPRVVAVVIVLAWPR